MHESSLVTSLLRQVEKLAQAQGGGRISEVRLEIGPLAGIEPLLLSETFRRLRNGTMVAEAELVIDPVGLTCHCRGCQLDYASNELQFVCPTCGGREVDVIGGDAVTLISITVASEPDRVLA